MKSSRPRKFVVPRNTYASAVSLIFVLACAISQAAFRPALAQVSGISYTITPGAEYYRFGKDAGLTNGLLFGGKVGFAFGELVELSGVYEFSRGLETKLTDLPAFDNLDRTVLENLEGRNAGLQRYGAELKFNVGRRRVIPFVSVGTGVVRIEPKDLNASESVYLSTGVGAQYSVRQRYTLKAQVTSLSYRINPASALLSAEEVSTLGVDLASSDPEGTTGLAVGLGMEFYLGGRSRGELTDLDRAFQEQFRSGLRGLSVRVEPFASSINFDEELGFRDNQRMAGVSAGLNLGPYVGLRGFYWRGMKEDTWTKFDKVQAFGGELRLKFEQFSGGLSPHIIVGGGYMDVLGGYVGRDEAIDIQDRPFAIGGLGVNLPLGDAVSINAGMRSILMSSRGVDNVSDASSVHANLMFSGGLSFAIGGSGATAGSLIGSDLQRAKTRQEQLDAEIARMNAEMANALARIDSLSRTLENDRPNSARSSTGSAAVTTAASIDGSDAVRDAARDGRSNERWMSVPVPTEGEIYIRFGGSGSVSVESQSGSTTGVWYDPVTGAIYTSPDTIQRTSELPVTATDRTPMTDAEIETIVSRIMERRVPDPPSELGQPAATVSTLDTLQREFNIDSPADPQTVASPKPPVVRIDDRETVPGVTRRPVGGDSTTPRTVTDSTATSRPSATVDSLAVPTAKTPQTGIDPLRVDIPKINSPTFDSRKIDTVKTNTAKTNTAKTDTAKIDAVKIDAVKIDTLEVDTAIVDTTAVDTTRTDGKETRLILINRSDIAPTVHSSDQVAQLRIDEQAAVLDAERVANPKKPSKTRAAVEESNALKRGVLWGVWR